MSAGVRPIDFAFVRLPNFSPIVRRVARLHGGASVRATDSPCVTRQESAPQAALREVLYGNPYGTPMKCQACGDNEATVHLTDVSNNEKREVHLCEDCARAQQVTIKSYLHKQSSKPQKQPFEILSKLVQSQTESYPDEKELACPRCGTTYKTFRATGKFGCPNDYAVFKQGLVNLLEKIHGKVQHAGKVPLRASDQIERQRQLRALRAELERAVQGEAYEKAAEIRDRIYDLEGRERSEELDGPE